MTRLMNKYLVLNSSGYLPLKVILRSKHLADSSWNMLQRHNLHSHSVCFSPLFVMFETILSLLVVFKRGKSTPRLGAFHTSDIPEFYGSGAAPDSIGTDALGMFVAIFMLLLIHLSRCY